MESQAFDIDDSDLERLFAEARRHPLLTAEQEREIDGSKWAAVQSMQALFIKDPALREFVALWSLNSATTPIDIAYFDNREHHFILRREMGSYVPGGKLSDRMENLSRALNDRHRSNKFLSEKLEALELPASLVVGIAAAVQRANGLSIKDSVADALCRWASFWDVPSVSATATLAETTTASLDKLQKQYASARDKLTMHNLRLVYSIAGRHKGKGVGYLDLIQEGTLGLIRAAEKYDYKKGFRFSTYCFNWITQAIRRHVGDAGALVRYPTHVQEQVNKLYRIRAEEAQRSGLELSEETLADRAGMSIDKTRELLQLRNLGVSLDAPQFDDDDITLLDTISGGPFRASESRAEVDSLQDCLLGEIRKLDASEQQVIVGRWGLKYDRPLSRAELADKMSISREWVRQLEQSALTKLSANERIRSTFADYVTAD